MKTKLGISWRLPRSADFPPPASQIPNLPNPDPAPSAPSRRTFAFTLLELLVVITIIGLLAGLAVPVFHNFKPNYTASTTRQLLDALARGRQLAISQRTTVYMVFVPTNFWNDPAFNAAWATNAARSTNLWDKQFIGYNYVTLHSLGDQPGRPTVQYLSSWRALPDGAYIALQKFANYNPLLPPLMIVPTNINSGAGFPVYGFDHTNGIPFPTEDAPRSGRPNTPFVTVPFIAFDYMGRLASHHDELIPLTRGGMLFARGGDRRPLPALPSINELPPGNTTNGYNLIYIDWITGRARVEHQEVQ